MTKGLEIRAQIDTENVKGLLLINGGGAVALLAFFPAILGKPQYEPLLRTVVWALLTFHIGIVAAVIHNRMRRVCSLHYEQHDNKPPPCKSIPERLIKYERLKQPCICLRSLLFMWLSTVCFVAGGLWAGYGALQVVDRVDPKQMVNCWQLQELQKKSYKVNQCTGTFERIELISKTPNKALQPTQKPRD